MKTRMNGLVTVESVGGWCPVAAETAATDLESVRNG